LSAFCILLGCVAEQFVIFQLV